MKLFIKLLVPLALVGGICLLLWERYKANQYLDNGMHWIDSRNGLVVTRDSFSISKRAVKLGQPVVSMRADTRLTKTDTTFWLSKKPISLGKPHKIRYFLIGYIGVTREGKLWTGGIDTAMSTYPNKNKLCWWAHEKFIQYDILDIKILSITEQSKEDYDTFWKD